MTDKLVVLSTVTVIPPTSDRKTSQQVEVLNPKGESGSITYKITRSNQRKRSGVISSATNKLPLEL